MRKTPQKLRPLVKWHGGKSYLAREGIIPLFHTDYRTYVEPFAGGLTVLLNRPPPPSRWPMTSTPN